MEDLSTKASQSSDQAVPVQSPAQSSQSPAQSDSCTSAEQGGDKPVASSDVPSEATSLEEGGEEPSKKGSPPGQSPAPPKTWQSLDKRWFNYDLMPKVCAHRRGVCMMSYVTSLHLCYALTPIIVSIKHVLMSFTDVMYYNGCLGYVLPLL